MSFSSLHFIGEAIEVEFEQPPIFSKRPGCPDRFTWLDQTHDIIELLSEWHEFERKGRMAVNMRPENLAAASKRGSWGVGRFYFRVRSGSGQVFDLYYDHAPGKANDRAGSWFLYRELTEEV